MFGKTDEARYLDHLVMSMRQNTAEMELNIPREESLWVTHFADHLATLAVLRLIAELVAASDPGRATSRRVKEAQSVLMKATDAVGDFIAMTGLSWNAVAELGLRESKEYLGDPSADVVYQHE